MLKEGRLVYKYLYQGKGIVYICGKIAMADAVTDAIIEAIDKHMTKEEKLAMTATDFINGMKDEGRFKQDLFG